MSQLRHLHPSDWQGLTRLAVDGVIGTTRVVEQLHATISGLALPLGRPRGGTTRGITGLVYRSIHTITGLVGSSSDFAFGRVIPRLGARRSSPRRERLLSTLNGVLGDHLEASGNPLAIRMRLRQAGRALELDRLALQRQIHNPSPRVLIALHGLCMNDLQWPAAEARHGLPEALGRELGYTPLYLHYNTGRRIADNGRELAELLDTLVETWPVPIEEIVLLGHSMGGLVARSAGHFATLGEHAWAKHLRKVVMLGSPHHGAPLERLGHQVEQWLSSSPYSAPFTRIGQLRSAGITDLRHGRLLDDPTDADPTALAHPSRRVAVVATADYHVIAATTSANPNSLRARMIGDGLVPLASALGEHPDPSRCLALPDARRLVLPATTHLGLLCHPQVLSQVRDWLR